MEDKYLSKVFYKITSMNLRYMSKKANSLNLTPYFLYLILYV